MRDYIQVGGGGGWRVLYYNIVGLCRQGQWETTYRWVGGGGGGECCTTTLLVCSDRASERLHTGGLGGGGGECCTATLLVCADRASERLHTGGLEGGGGGGECCTTTLLVCADRASQRLHTDAVWERQPEVPGLCLSPQHDGRPSADPVGQEGQVCAHRRSYQTLRPAGEMKLGRGRGRREGERKAGKER